MARVVPPDPQLAAALRRLRIERGLTQEDLGHRAGLTTGGYSKVERAQTAPAWGTVRQIAAALDLTIGQLAAEVDREAAGKRRGTKRR